MKASIYIFFVIISINLFSSETLDPGLFKEKGEFICEKSASRADFVLPLQENKSNVIKSICLGHANKLKQYSKDSLLEIIYADNSKESYIVTRNADNPNLAYAFKLISQQQKTIVEHAELFFSDESITVLTNRAEFEGILSQRIH